MELSPDFVDDLKFFPMLKSLVDCLCAELEKEGGPGLCYCGLMVGNITPLGLMNCKEGSGCGGVAYVRPVSVFPTTSFPLPADPATTLTCSSPMAMEVAIGVARCYPRPQGRATVPDPQAMFNAARLYMGDMQAVRRAVACCFGARPADRRKEAPLFSMGSWSPIPAGAGVSGGEWQIFIG